MITLNRASHTNVGTPAAIQKPPRLGIDFRRILDLNELGGHPIGTHAACTTCDSIKASRFSRLDAPITPVTAPIQSRVPSRDSAILRPVQAPPSCAALR